MLDRSLETFDATFPRDTEFQKLLGRRNDVDVVVAALELARDADRKLDFESTRRWIAERAAEVSPATTVFAPERSLDLLCEHLGEQWELRGDPDAFRDPESSYLSHVIETRRGLPISLSLLYVAVGRLLGLRIDGVAAPAHFLVRCETPAGRQFVDAYDGGRVLGEREAVAMLGTMTSLPPARIRRSLVPASARTIVLRILNNLKQQFVGREEWFPALRVQRRLAALLPGRYVERRDLAVLSCRAGRWSQAIELLQRCLRNCPREDSQTLQEFLQSARNRHAGWN